MTRSTWIVRACRTVLVAFVAALLSVLVVGTGTAVAATQFGQRAADEVLAIVRPVLIALAALIMLTQLGRRQVGAIIGVALMTLVIGTFAFSPGSVKTIITDIAAAVASR